MPGPAVAAVSPAPTDEEAAAIVAAVELLWPRQRGGRAVAAAVGVEVQRSLVDPADPAAARPPVDVAVGALDAVEASAARADDRVDDERDVPPRYRGGGRRRTRAGDAYEHHGIAYTTLPRPPGELRCRVATVNDVHFGETEAGRVGASDLGRSSASLPVRRPIHT